MLLRKPSAVRMDVDVAYTGFEANPHAGAACQVRRWDDQAKDPDAAVPAVEHFAPLLAALAR
ncbi:MAG: hypothetical protein WBH47_08045 [Streptosporangiaceae bacterium]